MPTENDLLAGLQRTGDEPVAAAPAKKTRKSLSESDPMPVQSEQPAAAAPAFALEPVKEPASESALAAENAELKARLDRMEQLLFSMQPAPVAASVKKDELDHTRPFSKTRTMGGGVTFEQDGRKFNARGQLMTEAA